MKTAFFLTGMAALLITFLTSCTSKQDEPVAVIPKSAQLTQMKGSVTLSSQYTIFLSDPDRLSGHASYLTARLKSATGLDLKTSSSANSRSIRLETDPVLTGSLGQEGYTLDVVGKSILIRSASAAGIFYGIQTLFQLLPPEIYSSEPVNGVRWRIPRVSIKDSPRFEWRGYMLDVSRHFFPASYLYDVIDNLAMHKLNRLHLHLSDDQGWRVEIKKYPKLTEIGAWRVNQENRHWNAREPQKPGDIADYGGFYTQEEIHDLVKYASERQITIVPEIEMPAHATAALASYPEYSCTGEPMFVLPGGIWPCDNIFCAGKEETFAFLSDILTEIMELFPSEYIHIGGDEADKTQWTRCPACQRRIRSENLKDENELQSYFIRRMDRFLTDHGRKLIGWDEILEGGLAPNAAVMSWRGMEGGIASARAGHKVVMAPTSHCYIDYYQGAPELEPLAIGGYVPLEKVYSFEPVPEGLTPEESKLILGAQANLWTEYISPTEHADYMTYPRLTALSEVCWTPPADKDFSDFTNRLTRHVKRYSFRDINYSNSFATVNISTQRNPSNGSVEVTMETRYPGTSIHYTLDGTDPDAEQARYDRPLTLESSATIKAVAILEESPVSRIAVRRIRMHLASGRPIIYEHPFSERYTGGGADALVDGIRGSINYSDGSWQGFNGSDLVAVIDLGSEQTIRKITLGTLQAAGSWIFFPTRVECLISLDNQAFTTAGEVNNPLGSSDPDRTIQDLSVSFEPVNARYVKVIATSLGTCPAGHSGAGQPCWLFADEIVVE